MGQEATPETEGESEETIETPEGTVRYARFRGEGPTRGKPILFLPGYGMGLTWGKPVGRALMEGEGGARDRDVFVLEHSRTEFEFKNIEDLKALYPNARREAWALPRAILRRAHEACLVLRTTGTPAHLVGHSLGGMDSVAVALLAPELVASMTLINSGGLLKPHLLSAPVLFGRFIGNWAQELLQKAGIWGVIKDTFIGYIFKNKVRAVAEEVAVAHTDLREIIYGLGRSGVPITIVNDEHDRVFPADKTAAHMLPEVLERAPYRVVETNEHLHYGPVTNPKAIARVAREAIDTGSGD